MNALKFATRETASKKRRCGPGMYDLISSMKPDKILGYVRRYVDSWYHSRGDDRLQEQYP